MAMCRFFLFAILAILAGASSSQAASIRSKNFVVEAPSEKLAREFAQLAEHYRKQKAIEWLGKEMPDWSQPCPLRITIQQEGAGGATEFTFSPNGISQTMHIEGKYERLKDSVLPHEVTHTVFAYHFRQPVPRWADEGGSVYSEDERERRRHDDMCRQILNSGEGIPLRRLFGIKDYREVRNVMALYAQGYSVTRFLVESSDQATFLDFVALGMNRGWNEAVRKFYNYKSVDDLEAAWLSHLKKTGGRSAVAKNNESAPTPTEESTGRLTVRQSAWPSRPELDPTPTARGSGLSLNNDRESFNSNGTSGWNRTPARLGPPEPLVNNNPRTEPYQTTSTPNNRSTSSSRPAPPPPVVLFPPEPIR